MLEQIEKLVAMFEQKHIDRRQLIGLLLAAAAAPAAPAEAAPSVFDGRVVNHVTINGSDLERSRAFYEKLLGVTVLHDGSRASTRFYNLGLKGDCFLALTAAGPPRIDHLCVGIPNFDQDRAAAEVRKAFPNSKVTANPPAEPGGWRAVFVTDPDGNSVQLADVKYQLDGRR